MTFFDNSIKEHLNKDTIDVLTTIVKNPKDIKDITRRTIVICGGKNSGKTFLIDKTYELLLKNNPCLKVIKTNGLKFGQKYYELKEDDEDYKVFEVYDDFDALLCDDVDELLGWEEATNAFTQIVNDNYFHKLMIFTAKSINYKYGVMDIFDKELLASLSSAIKCSLFTEAENGNF